MEEHVSHQGGDGTVDIISCSETYTGEIIADEENHVAGNMNDTKSGLSSEMDNLTEQHDMDESSKQHKNTETLLPKQGNDIDNEKTKDDQGNLLSDVVTMHMTNCDDDDYSPTLAICDIFSNTKASTENEQSALDNKEEEGKDEFLIIDLDTCKMERASKKQQQSETELSSYNKRNVISTNSSKGLVSINLSSSEETESDFLGKVVERDPRDKQCENNFLHITKDCDSDTSFDQRERLGKGSIVTLNGQCASIEKHKITPLTNDEALHQIELHLPMKSGGMKIDDTFQEKEILFHDMSHDSGLSNDYSADASFQADINMSLQSNENQECEPVFYMPYDKNNDQPSSAFTKISALNSSPLTDNCNQYYEYTFNDNGVYETLSSGQHSNATSYEFYEQHQTHFVPHYSPDDKGIIGKMVAVDTRRKTSPTNGLSYPENASNNVYKKVSATCGSHKLSFYPTSEEHKSPFFSSTYLPTYPAPYPYNFQQTSDASPQISSVISNYSDWNSWSNSAFYDVNLNSFPSVPNIDSQYYQEKEAWPNDASMSNLYYDPQVEVKCNQVDNDSEATEDADEIDDVPTFFEDSSEFSTCDNLSNMSVMSSCYSDSSSVMTPFSPSDFTPPPSASNTPVPSTSNQDVSNVLDERFGAPFMDENSQMEPFHMYSPTMLSVPPYKLANVKCEQNIVNYDQCHQSSKRFYPSMADIHNSKSGLMISSTSSKFDNDDVTDCPDYTQSHKSQIQSDKISTSTSRGIFNKRKWIPTTASDNESLESFADFIKQDGGDLRNELRKCRHNEPLRQTAIRIMSLWYEQHLDNPYPTKEDKLQMAREGGITVTQVKSWFANKRNRTNNTKPKVQKRAMKEKLKKLFQDLKHSRTDSLDNSHIIQQLSGIIQT